mmetsp:Transcript_20688/g.20031  ORF Transcript_20688/g.20031 Transcript_20688/m.20031 type:complete len:256 (-) Transcript_20688:354-1121(-)|eukprot:CAMPEP_0119042768 /NCGR_PEP_ID=MMETSP1177-20130426/16143_1 /TAXON_ID=2985 /ORGANISM="Ochromonas sp, Strain CCMP1899" /LENGTH=255 /DNA_ID=CAMNT_0007009771 /DNA_START=59 /DNA_END=826 /DNA_ORIENTATION=-
MKLILFAVAIVACNAFVIQPPPTLSLRSRLTRKAVTDFVETEKNTDIAGSPNDLISRAKDILYNKSGFYSSSDPTLFSEEFVFRGPNIGPLNKKDYFQTMTAFGISKAIPDINPNAWGYSIDPIDPNRVWFMVRNTGTFTGDAIAPGSLNYKSNGSKLQGCPETFSLTFDDQQKVKYLSVGYVADRFQGNTKGKGAAVGIFMATGLPFPPIGKVQSFFQWFGSTIAATDTGPLSYSTKNIPKWWTDKKVGSEGYL